MKGHTNKDYEWVKPLNEYLFRISSVFQEYECEDIESLLKFIKSRIWHSDYIISRGILEDSILEVEESIEKLPELFKDLNYYLGDNGEYIDKDDIIRITTHNLKRLLKELKSLQGALLRKIKATLPNGIEKDGVRIKSHATAATLVAFFRALQEENVIFDKDLSNITIAKFISENFSTRDSSPMKLLSVDHLENIFSNPTTCTSIGFIATLKKITLKLEKLASTAK